MTLNDYQEQAMTTCMESSNNFSYMMLNLVGEVGEFASKVAKAIRKGRAHIGGYNYIPNQRYEQEPNVLYPILTTKEDVEFNYNNAEELQKEAGDILWQLAGLCHVMGWSLEDVAQHNLDKLASRQARGKIDGNGDNR